ncbi:MAG: alanine racemase [Candidatus Hydrogenedentota bacterium]
MKNNYLNFIEIDRKNLLWNLKCIKKVLKKNTGILPVVKANAYGHSLEKVVTILKGEDIFGFGVNSLEEGIEVRKLCGNRIILLGGLLNSELHFLFEYNLEPTVFRIDTLKFLEDTGAKKNKIIKVHLKVETGTNRQGVDFNEIAGFLEFFKKSRFVRLEGLSTHFANIEDTTNHTYAFKQKNEYKKFLKLFKKNKIDIHCKHIACSAAGLLFPDTHYNFIRLGISLYGLWPSKETYLSCLLKHKNIVELKPVLSWKTKIVQLKNVSHGKYVGYGCTYKTTNKTKLAILPIGYYDGYDRKLSNQGFVIIRGKRAPVCGRVCMNITIVDVTDIFGVSVEDEVILIGRSADESITADDIARMTGTINYEVVSRLNPLIPRIVIND